MVIYNAFDKTELAFGHAEQLAHSLPVWAKVKAAIYKYHHNLANATNQVEYRGHLSTFVLPYVDNLYYEAAFPEYFEAPNSCECRL